MSMYGLIMSQYGCIMSNYGCSDTRSLKPINTLNAVKPWPLLHTHQNGSFLF